MIAEKANTLGNLYLEYVWAYLILSRHTTILDKFIQLLTAVRAPLPLPVG